MEGPGSLSTALLGVLAVAVLVAIGNGLGSGIVKTLGAITITITGTTYLAHHVPHYDPRRRLVAS